MAVNPFLSELSFKIPEIKMTVTTFFYYNCFVKFTITRIVKQILYFYIK